MQKLKVKKQKGDERLVWGKWEEEEKREGGRYWFLLTPLLTKVI